MKLASKQIQALEHAVNYLVASAGVLMDGGTRTLSVLSVIASGGRYVILHSRQFTSLLDYLARVRSLEALLFLTP